MPIFNPEQDIPEFFWAFIATANGDHDFCRQLLEEMDRDKILALFSIFIDARTELVEQVLDENLMPDASEDTLDDVCDAIIVAGKQIYLDIYSLKQQIPEDIEERPTFVYVFDEVYYERFGVSPTEEVD